MKPFARRMLLAGVLLLQLLTTALAAAPWHAARQNTSGWQFMTPDERVEHQRLMRSFTTYQECKAYQQKRHAEMAARARQAGAVLEASKESGCDKLRARGRLE
jgi:hypothetical protein